MGQQQQQQKQQPATAAEATRWSLELSVGRAGGRTGGR